MLFSPNYYQNYFTKLAWDVSSSNEILIENTDIEIYPNPAAEILHIQSQDQIVNIKIYNSIGNIVFDQFFQDYFLSINSSQFLSGFYLVSIETDKKVINRKVFIQ